jgi:3-deoxy-manno-octulosonate cytidylyltransferase (CMP-KDO synthetase)
MFRVVIPARYGSTRLTGKPLRMIAGKPMIAHVYERARVSGAAEVWVATDDARIEAACREFGARVVMTADTHPSGTDRIAEVAMQQKWADADIVVDLQGDEPLMPPALVSQVAKLLAEQPAADMATLATPIHSLPEFLDPAVVKVALRADGTALYFSRAPIPWSRDGARHGINSQTKFDGALRHIGLYAHRVRTLRRIAALPPAVLEETEKLEQLRALESGMAITVGIANASPGQPVDTAADLEQVIRIIENDTR